MMNMRRFCAAAAAACALGGAAGAGAEPRKVPPPEDPRLKPDLRAPASPRGGDMLTLAPVGGEGGVGLGRFSIPAPAGPRTNLEPERDPTDLSRRRRGIGGVGLRMSF